MSTAATKCTFNIQPGGNDLNGGAFKRGFSGTDSSTDDDPICIIDGSSVTATKSGSENLIVSGYSVQSSDIGNCLFGQLNDSAATWIQSGPIASVNTSTNIWAFSGTQPWDWYTTTGFTSARLGGALATPGGLADPSALTTGRLGNFSVCYIKSGTYTMTSSDCESGGRVQLSKAGLSLIAYKDAPGDHEDYPDHRVIIDTGSTATDSNGVIYFSSDASVYNITGLELRGNTTWARAFNGIHSNARNCVAKEFTQFGFYYTNKSSATSCRAESCGSGSSSDCGFNSAALNECIAIDCDPSGFYNYVSAARCVAHGGTYGFYQTADINAAVTTCVADGATGTGFWTNQGSPRATNCVAINCGTGVTEIENGGGNAFWNNTQNFSATSNLTHASELQLTSNPFNDSAAYDYSLNDISGGGSELATRSPKFGAGVSEGGPQQQQSAQLKSTGGGSSVFPAYPHQSGT